MKSLVREPAISTYPREDKASSRHSKHAPGPQAVTPLQLNSRTITPQIKEGSKQHNLHETDAERYLGNGVKYFKGVLVFETYGGLPDKESFDHEEVTDIVLSGNHALTSKELSTLLLDLPNLRKLNLNRTALWPDPAILAERPGILEHLEEVYLYDNTSANDANFSTVIRHPERLKELCIAGKLSQCSLKDVHLDNIHRLYLFNNPVVTNQNIANALANVRHTAIKNIVEGLEPQRLRDISERLTNRTQRQNEDREIAHLFKSVRMFNIKQSFGSKRLP